MIKSAAKSTLADNPLAGAKYWGGGGLDVSDFLKGGYNDAGALSRLGKNRVVAEDILRLGYDQATLDKLLGSKGVSKMDYYINPRTGTLVPKAKRTWGKYAPGGAAGGAALGALGAAGLESALGIDDEYNIGSILGGAGGAALGSMAPSALEELYNPQKGVLHSDITLGDNFRIRGNQLQRKGRNGWKEFGKKVYKRV